MLKRPRAEERVLGGENVLWMHLLGLETTWWFLIGTLPLAELAVLVLSISVGKLWRALRSRDLGSVGMVSRRDPTWVLNEIERMGSGEDANESLIKQMTAEDRTLFDVSVVDALNRHSQRDQRRLRAVLIRYGYDEQCARRAMSDDFSDRIRASALLSLLRPNWREISNKPEPPTRLKA